MATLSPQQIADCVAVLSQLDPGLLPIEIFDQVARLTRIPTVLIIPVRKNQDKLEFGLVKRGPDEHWWPNLWHIAGTVLRSTDTLQTAFDRLFMGELKTVKNNSPVFQNFLVHQTDRGTELQLVYSLEQAEFGPESGVQWFALDALPAEFVESEKGALTEVLKQFS